MIITSSQISMDASSGHMDVSRTGSGEFLSRNHAGRREEQFQLNVPHLEELFSRQDGTRPGSAPHTRAAAGTGDGGRPRTGTPFSLNAAIEALLGRRTSITGFDPRGLTDHLLDKIRSPAMGGPRFFRIGGQPFSMTFAARTVQFEYEYLNFSAGGDVATADGRTINFSFDLTLQRTSVIRDSFLGRAATGALVDPLVLHFDGGLDCLSEESFRFDLAGNGEQRLIPGLHQGSGFLALDIDGDRAITSGRELFGPRSGSGFADLACHDADGNNWIDENDPIFPDLCVWMNASGGEQTLLSLKEAGVGALSLTGVDARFDLRTGSADLRGRVASSGIFITEDGRARPLQDLDLAVDTPDPDESGAKPAARSGSADDGRTHLHPFVAARHRQMTLLAERHPNRDRDGEEEEDLGSRFWKWQEEAGSRPAR